MGCKGGAVGIVESVGIVIRIHFNLSRLLCFSLLLELDLNLLQSLLDGRYLSDKQQHVSCLCGLDHRPLFRVPLFVRASGSLVLCIPDNDPVAS